MVNPTVNFSPEYALVLERFGMKLSQGGSHISRTLMLAELEALLEIVPVGSTAKAYREAILQHNALGKTTDATRQKSYRHLRELYSLDEATPIFGLLRKLHSTAFEDLHLLAIQVAWARDSLLRATSGVILDAEVGQVIRPSTLADAVQIAFPNHYSELNRNKIARNAASSWTQSGHLAGRTAKVRQLVRPSAASITMALFLGSVCGYNGAEAFGNPWCRLLDLTPDKARSIARDAHSVGLLNLRAVGDVVELAFPLLAEFLPAPL